MLKLKPGKWQTEHFQPNPRKRTGTNKRPLQSIILSSKSTQMRVLVVDDNQKFRELLRDYLTASVDEIYECADGSQALALYQKHLPEWVLMDWQMPEMDGITATRAIIAEYPNATICLITSYDDEVLRIEAIKAGAIKFVLKKNLFELPEILIGKSNY